MAGEAKSQHELDQLVKAEDSLYREREKLWEERRKMEGHMIVDGPIGGTFVPGEQAGTNTDQFVPKEIGTNGHTLPYEKVRQAQIDHDKAKELLDLAQKLKEEQMGAGHDVEVAELRPVEDPIDKLREEYDFPEEWLEGLDGEEPPSPERLRSLAEGIANREVNDEIELPAKAFARVLLLVAQQMEMMMEWAQMQGAGDTVHPHRHVRVRDAGTAYVAEISVPKHVFAYGVKTADRHLKDRYDAAMSGVGTLRGN